MPLRILADENVPYIIVSGLRQSGHDVEWVVEEGAGTPDETLLPRAEADGRVLLTYDKGFGERIFRQKIPFSAGLILLRLGGRNPAEAAERALAALSAESDWAGHYSVITQRLIRTVKLPPAGS